MNISRDKISQFFIDLQNKICDSYIKIEEEYIKNYKEDSCDYIINSTKPKFIHKSWNRNNNAEDGGGEMRIMHGNVFEKVGVNYSRVQGKFSDEFKSQIPGAENDPNFFATGISLVAHMNSPHIPAMHFNIRFIQTTKSWFGGGCDITPMLQNQDNDKIVKYFHSELQNMCNKHDATYYSKYKKQCDDYFFLKHRNESRGAGGIFCDYLYNDLDSNDNKNEIDSIFEHNFAFIQDIGNFIYNIWPLIVRDHMYKSWSKMQKESQFVKRGRYVEFNLLYDRGTAFGLKTGGNVDAIFMSMPPTAKWK